LKNKKAFVEKEGFEYAMTRSFSSARPNSDLLELAPDR